MKFLNEKSVPFTLYIVFFVLHILFTSQLQSPFFYADEMGYFGNAREIATGEGGADYRYSVPYHPGYSLLLAPVFFFTSDTYTAYKVVLVINSVILSFVPVLLYSILRFYRRELSVASRFAVAVCISLFPGFFLYSNLVMSEVVILPLVLGMILLLMKLKNSLTSGAFLFISFLSGFSYFVHPRLLVLPLSLLIFSMVIGGKMLFRRTLAVIVGSLIGYVTAVLLLVRLLPKNHDVVRTALNLFNENTLVFFSKLFGQLTYVSAGTILMSLFGIFFSCVALRRYFIKQEYSKYDIFSVYVFLTFGLSFVLSVFSLSGARVDHLFYGRYIEVFLPALMLFGLIFLARRWEKIGYYVFSFVVLLGGAFMARMFLSDSSDLHRPYLENTFGLLWPLYHNGGAFLFHYAVLIAFIFVIFVFLLRRYSLVVGSGFLAGIFFMHTCLGYFYYVLPASNEFHAQKRIIVALNNMVNHYGDVHVCYDRIKHGLFVTYNHHLFFVPKMKSGEYGKSDTCDLLVTRGSGIAHGLSAKLLVTDTNGDSLWRLPGAFQESQNDSR